MDSKTSVVDLVILTRTTLLNYFGRQIRLSGYISHLF